MATTTGSITQTSDADFSQGTRYQTLISGTGTSASIILDPETENNIQILNPKSEIGVGGIWEVRFTTKGNPKYPYLAINLKSQDEFGKDISFEGLYCDDQLISPKKYLKGENWIYVWNWECKGEGKFKAKILKEGVQIIEFNFGGSSQVAENYSQKSQSLSPQKSKFLSKIKFIQEAFAADNSLENEIQNPENSGIFDFFSKIGSGIINLLHKIEESFAGFISNLKTKVLSFFEKEYSINQNDSSKTKPTQKEIESIVLSFIFEGENIKILNPYSNPEKGGNWEVFFETKAGPAKLTITPDKRSEFGKELEFLGIYCGDEEIKANYDGEKVIVENWNCEGKGKFVTRVLDAGAHLLQFKYKGDEVFAQNFACDSGDLNSTCYVTSSQDVTGATISGTGNLVIQSGGSLYTSAASSSCNISMGGDITINSANGLNGNFNVTSTNLTINSEASISANAKGYAGGGAGAGAAGSGPGAGSGGASGGGGAGYGGKGGNGYNGSGGSSYGSLTQPTDLGSGGGDGSSCSGGAGGGAIKLVVSGTLTINGQITANGADGGTNGSYGGGGGSGGSIWIQAGTITGNGTTTANGGAGGGSTNGGGGGAGGRIAIYYKTNNLTGTVSANGGSGYQAGGNGTIYWSQFFYPSGYFISSVIDTIANTGFGTLVFSVTTSASTTIKFQLRSGKTIDELNSRNFVGPDGSTSTYYLTSNTSIWSGHSGDRYIQYKAYLDTTDTFQTPYLNDVTINYYYIASSGTLISSPYDTSDSANVVAKIQWTATTPASTTIKFQIRTSPDGSNWTDWCGPDDPDNSTTTCSTSTYFIDPSGGEPIDEMFKDGQNDRWIQYKVILETEDPTKTPVLDDVSITYVVNAPPEFNPQDPPKVTVASSTEVQIYYSIRDPDTNEGSPQNQWKVWLANLEYSVDGGQTWIPISSSTITKPPNIGDYIPLGPSTSTWIATTTYWNAKAQNPNIYSTTTYIRITIDDHEAANNTAVATVGPFTLDTKDPQVGTPPGGGTGININQNATTSLGNDKTSTTSVTIYLSANDDSPLKMRIWENGGQDSGWVDYSPTYPFTLTSEDGLKTVYVKFKDSFGNEVGAYSDTIYLDTTPPEAKNPFVQDVSNSQTSEWRIFFNWAKATESDFTKYEVYFATSTAGPFTLLATITNKDLNYVLHENLTQGEQYCYKAKYYDDLQNYSETSPVCQVAGGQPSDTVPPEISNVTVSEITLSSAKITWQTNEPASTQVLYSVDNSFSNIQGIAGYDTSHSVTLVGLNASTTYNFKVKSCDGANNCSESSPSQFTTLAGDTSPPSISNISVSEITHNSAKISWITDEPSDSFVEYSTSSGFSYGIMVGSKEATTSHSVLLTNLNASTTYYFKVHSRDLAGNEAVSLESSFITQSAPPLDTTPPTISNITVSNIQYNTALISWQTDEPASSYVEFGLSTSYGRIYGQDDSTTSHSVQLPKDLIPDSTYHFRVRSRDLAGNEAISQDFTFTTAESPQDTTPPTITFDPSTGIGQPSETQVTISWTTNEDSDSFIDYSTDKSFSLSQGSPQMTTQHSVTLVGLKPGTQYFFRIRSTDPSGNRAILDNNGQGFSFVTASGPNPPVISNIQITDVTYNSVKISWQTDIPSNSLVEYGFDTSYGKIAGQNDSTTFHSVTLTGLLSQATYHFRVRSKAQTEAVSQDYTFTTQPAPSITLAEQPGPPQISQVSVPVISHNSAIIIWVTNEPATSKVVFGISTSYGMETPEENILTIKHAVTLTGLNKETTYYFKVISKDSSGNESVDDNSGKGYTFTTTKEPGQVITVTVGGGVTTVIPPGYATKEQLCKEMGLYWYDNSCHKEPKEKKPEEKAKELEKEIEEFGVPELMQRASKAFVTKVLESLPKNPFLKEIPEEKFISSVTEIAPKVVLAPQITGGAPQVEVGPDWVKITWITDKKSNSLVAIAKEKDYDPKKDEPYTMVVGNPDELVTSHSVTITGLEPATTYYFQVRSKPLVGPLAKSDNLTFKTLSKKLEISDITFTEISERGVTLTFKTNLPSATKIFYTNLRTQEKKEFEDKSFLRDHALTLKDLEPNTEYSLVILAKEETGNEATSPTLTFSTGKDTTPPEISQVRTSLAISPRGDTVQAVITWLTNEPATSRVYFVQGASWKEELVKSTSLDKTLSIKHTVLLPALKPGQVYRFRAESIDSSGNVSLSKDFTFLTPQQKKTIIQIMISQFEKIFGWVKRIRF